MDGQLSSSGVQTLVPLLVQGPVGEVPATAPFNIPLHHRYRRWMGGVSRRHIFSCKAYSTEHHGTTTLAATRSAIGTAGRRGVHLLVIFFFCLQESNRRLQAGHRLH